LRLRQAGGQLRVALTGFVLVLTAGLSASALLVRDVTVAWDSSRQLPDVSDLRVRYAAPRLEAVLHGPMGEYLPPGRERDRVLRWARVERDRSAFYAGVRPILGTRCVTCHGAGGVAAAGIALSDFAQVAPLLERGPPARALLRHTHTHLLGVGLLLLVVGALVAATRAPAWLRAGLAGLGPLALLVETGSWWWARTWEGAAWLVAGASTALAACWAGAVLLILLDLWTPGGRE